MTYKTTINPKHLGISVEGPYTLVKALTEDDILITLDVSGKEPHPSDYLIAPDIHFGERFKALSVVSKSQKSINVHVYSQKLENISNPVEPRSRDRRIR